MSPDQARRDGAGWVFYRDAGQWWFGPAPAGAQAADLTAGPIDDLDNLQVLMATGYLQRCGRDDDAARVFAAQTGCTLEQAQQFCRDGEVPADAAFGPVPWLLTPLQAAQEAAGQRVAAGRRGLIAYGVGIVAAIALVFIILMVL